MFAIVRTGGKQYRVAEGDVIRVEKLSGETGDIVALGDVLMLGGETPKTGGPTIEGASVAAEVLGQRRGEKIIVFKRKRRKGYRRTQGHRQMLTELRITEILTDGKKPSTKAAEKLAAKKAEKPAPAEEPAAEEKAEPKSKAKPETKQTAAQKAAPKPAKKAEAKKAETKKAQPEKAKSKAAGKKPAKPAAKAKPSKAKKEK